MTNRRPNILLINCDDLGYGDLGCYGSTRNKTPHLDALARDGVTLNEFYMASPVCSASRAAMLTGCYPPRVGFGERPVLFPGEAIGLNPSERTIAGYLKDAGYATKIVGKWHCGDQPEFLPTRHGFDDYFGIPYSNDMGRQSNKPESPPLPLLRKETVIQEQPDQRGITERYTDECLQFIDAHREAPFFLYLAHMYVHVPLFVPAPFLEKSDNGAYGGAVECIDWSTGVLVDRLKRHGLLDNTLIVFTSDNGSRARDEGGSNAPCRGTKATTWEGGQRVPCIWHWPEGLSGGRSLDGIASSIDLLPTFCRMAEAEPENDVVIDGLDLSDWVVGRSESSPREVFCYYAGSALEAIRVGKWKLHVSKGGVWGRDDEAMAPMLCDLENDVGEERNRAADHPDVVERLMVEMESVRADLGDRLTGDAGRGRRAPGHVAQPKPLTQYRPDHPYIVAMYDMPDMPTLSG